MRRVLSLHFNSIHVVVSNPQKDENSATGRLLFQDLTKGNLGILTAHTSSNFRKKKPGANFVCISLMSVVGGFDFFEFKHSSTTNEKKHRSCPEVICPNSCLQCQISSTRRTMRTFESRHQLR